MTARSYRALGFDFRLDCDVVELCGVLERCLGDLAVADLDPRHTLRIRHRDDAAVNAASGATSDDVWFEVSVEFADGTVEICEEQVLRTAVVDVVAWEVNQRALATWIDAPVLHAAVAAGPGGAIVACGGSHFGKSTLAAVLGHRGFTYLSDDLAPLDPVEPVVTPYPRPLMLRPGGRERLSSIGLRPVEEGFFADDWFYAPSEFGTVGRGTVPIRAFVMMGWDATTTCTPIRAANALFRLTKSTMNLATVQAGGFHRLAALAELVPSFDLAIDDVWRAADLLTDLAAEESR